MAYYTKTTYQGRTVNAKTKQIVLAANALLRLEGNGGETSDMTMVQGSYNTSVSASGGTHSGGGAADMTPHNYKNRVKVLRKLGCAAWYRPAISGLWNAHIHFIVDGDPTASAAAEDQVVDYHNRRNGLANNGPDVGYQMAVFPQFIYGTTRARWICTTACRASSQPTGDGDYKIDDSWREAGYVTPESDLCRVRVGDIEWFVTRAGSFYKKSNFVRRPKGYVALAERWEVIKAPAYRRTGPGPDAPINTNLEPMALGNTFDSVGYCFRDKGGVSTKYVMTSSGNWLTGTSLTNPVIPTPEPEAA